MKENLLLLFFFFLTLSSSRWSHVGSLFTNEKQKSQLVAYLILLSYIVALFMTLLIKSAGHKMVSLKVVI